MQLPSLVDQFEAPDGKIGLRQLPGTTGNQIREHFHWLTPYWL